jgi:hypothetical protein
VIVGRQMKLGVSNNVPNCSCGSCFASLGGKEEVICECVTGDDAIRKAQEVWKPH